MEITLILAIVGLTWFWLDSLHVRELAVAAGKRAAEQYQLQFLDESVANTRLWAARDQTGACTCSVPTILKSATRGERLPRSVTLLGNKVEKLDMPPYRDNVVRLY